MRHFISSAVRWNVKYILLMIFLIKLSYFAKFKIVIIKSNKEEKA